MKKVEHRKMEILHYYRDIDDVYNKAGRYKAGYYERLSRMLDRLIDAVKEEKEENKNE